MEIISTRSSKGSAKDDERISLSMATEKRRFWDRRFVATNVILVILILASSYLEYFYYPSILVSSPFYETQITIHVSFFSYALDGVRCVVAAPPSGSPWPCTGPNYIEPIQGIPSLDFAQLFAIVLLLLIIYHYWNIVSRR